MDSKQSSATIDVKAVVIANKFGVPLVSLKIDPFVDETLMSPFISAIQLFCHNFLGQSHEMTFQSNGSDIYFLLKKYGDLELMIFSLLNSSMKKLDLHLESEMALDAFVGQYGAEAILNWDGNTSLFQTFADVLQHQVDLYIQKITPASAEDKNFFRRLMAKLLKM